jgi:hypothetical protein
MLYYHLCLISRGFFLSGFPNKIFSLMCTVCPVQLFFIDFFEFFMYLRADAAAKWPIRKQARVK